MQITQFSDIALRTLMYLTQQNTEELVQISELEGNLCVPKNHLIKVVNRLAKLQWVQTIRGRNGGLRLLADPDSLRIGTILQEVEGTYQLIDCEKTECGLRGACLLKGVLDDALDVFYQKLNETTLSDVVKSPTKEKIIQLYRLPN